MKRIFIPDYNIGNIRSVIKAFENLETKVIFSKDYKDIESSHIIVLPGDGAFGESINKLKVLNLEEPIKEAIHNKKPFLGICVGFQLIFKESEEFGKHKGLGIFEERVEKFNISYRIPHIGWNKVYIKDNSYFKDFSKEFFYFIHSYRVKWSLEKPYHTGYTNYGEKFTSIVEKENIIAVQFHPEKSQKVGLNFLKKFLEYSERFI